MTPSAIANVLKKKSGILLDISLGGEKQPNSVRMGPGGDIPHDPRRLPFPLPTGAVHTCVVVHTLEYLDPKDVFRWFDELHRVMRTGGIVYLSGPYGGDESHGWLSDPAHKTRIIETTFAWLDPATPIYPLHPTLARPLPKPWKVLTQARVPAAMGTVSYNVTLSAMKNGAK